MSAPFVGPFLRKARLARHLSKNLLLGNECAELRAVHDRPAAPRVLGERSQGRTRKAQATLEEVVFRLSYHTKALSIALKSAQVSCGRALEPIEEMSYVGRQPKRNNLFSCVPKRR